MGRSKKVKIVNDRPVIYHKGKLIVNLKAIDEMHDKLNALILKSQDYVQCDCYKCTDR